MHKNIIHCKTLAANDTVANFNLLRLNPCLDKRHNLSFFRNFYVFGYLGNCSQDNSQ